MKRKKVTKTAIKLALSSLGGQLERGENLEIAGAKVVNMIRNADGKWYWCQVNVFGPGFGVVMERRQHPDGRIRDAFYGIDDVDCEPFGKWLKAAVTAGAVDVTPAVEGVLERVA